MQTPKTGVNNRPCAGLLIALVILGTFPFLSSAAEVAHQARHDEPVVSKDSVLLISFFRGNGEDGLFLAWSRDGLEWTELKPPGKSFLEPAVGGKLMRDPSLALGPDGTFHMVWTTSWDRPPAFGYASSKNLIDWSEQLAIPVMQDAPDTENVWAPELFYDSTRSEWIVMWASTVPGRFPETVGKGERNHRIYAMTTADFKAFTPSRLFYDDGFNVIDATILPAKGRYYLVVKDETRNPVKKNLRLAVSDDPQGPYGPAGEPITISWVEGPSAIEIGGLYYIYFDHYVRPRYYGAIRSSDLAKWEDVSRSIRLPPGARHGTVLWAPWATIKPLANKQASVP
jgi:hypothetical protein